LGGPGPFGLFYEDNWLLVTVLFGRAGEMGRNKKGGGGRTRPNEAFSLPAILGHNDLFCAVNGNFGNEWWRGLEWGPAGKKGRRTVSTTTVGRVETHSIGRNFPRKGDQSKHRGAQQKVQKKDRNHRKMGPIKAFAHQTNKPLRNISTECLSTQ